MESNIIARPSMPQAAPVLSPAAPAFCPAAAVKSMARHAEKAVFGTLLTVDIPQVHQVQIQAKSGLTRALAAAGGYGDTRLVGTSVHSNTERMDVRGIPPRGKPV